MERIFENQKCNCIVCTPPGSCGAAPNSTWRERRAQRMGARQMPAPLQVAWKAECSCNACKHKKETADDHFYWRDRRPLRVV